MKIRTENEMRAEGYRLGLMDDDDPFDVYILKGFTKLKYTHMKFQ